MCGRFVLSETEYGVFFHTRVINSPRFETRRGKVFCPVPSETQGRAPDARGVRRGMHVLGQKTLPATTDRLHNLNGRKPR